jgi:parvulin-like peptidyl-prolyl isomerase
MKKLSQYSFSEVIQLQPLKALLKEIRNDLLLAYYKLKSAEYEEQFLEKNKYFKGKNILVVIAFEQPKVLEWLFALSSKNLKDFQLMVFDNSRNKEVRGDIKDLCDVWGIPYLSLPMVRSRHPNRSHGLAMTWVFHRIIKKIQPFSFGFLDHDMYPIRPVHLSELIPSEQNFYGLLNDSQNYWNLWAGYCFFKFSAISDKPLNFLYDFSRGVDTGGRNWSHIYHSCNKSFVKFASIRTPLVKFNDSLQAKIQLIDEVWVHVGGVSYSNHLESKERFHTKLVNHLLAGKSLHEIENDLIAAEIKNNEGIA